MRRSFSRLLDRYNPGITLLVAVWAAGFELKRRMMASGTLTQIADEALTSLLLVVPIMLIGWALIALADRRYRSLGR